MQTLEIDGVPVFHAPGPRRTTVELAFGVGVQDETFATREVTHLVEHLVMGALPKSGLQRNAVTTIDNTRFHATGRPEAVGEFVVQVCAAITELSLARVDREVGVLQAEDCSAVGGTLESLLAARYGMHGPGVAFATGPGPDHLTDRTIVEHARRWFVRGNAALVVHGDLPEGLRLGLPEGTPPGRTTPPRRSAPGASWTENWCPGVALGFSATGPWSPALRLALSVLQERVQDEARHERGLSYSAGVSACDVDAGSREHAVLVDAREGQEGAVAATLWEACRDLAANGPRPAELAHVFDSMAEELDGVEDVELAHADLVDAAVCHLLGLQHLTVRDSADAVRAVTAEEARDALRGVWGTALLQVPEWADFDGLPGLQRFWGCGWAAELPSGRTLKPSALVRVLPGPAKNRRFVLTDDGIAHRDADGDVHLIAWRDVDTVFSRREVRDPAGKVVDGGGLVVAGGNWCVFVVDEDTFGSRAVAEVTARIRRNVPEDRWAFLRISLAGTPVPVG